MSVQVGANNLGVVHKSSYQGQSVAAFPDVCKTPSPGGPLPIPYPNAGYGQQGAAGSKTTPAGSKPALTKTSNFSMSSGDEPGTLKAVTSTKLRGQLQMLHMQMAGLPSGNPTHWHKLLDQYVIVTAELYKTLSE